MPSKEYTGERSLITEPIIGYRIWFYKENESYLRSLNGERWINAEMVAECKAGDRHPTRYHYDHSHFNAYFEEQEDANLKFLPMQVTKELAPIPSPNCSCGIYARYFPQDLDDLLHTTSYHGPSVIGAILASGNVELGTRGFRAEKAKVLGVVVPYLDNFHKRDQKWFEDNFGIECFANLPQLVEKYSPSDLSSLLFPEVKSTSDERAYHNYLSNLNRAREMHQAYEYFSSYRGFLNSYAHQQMMMSTAPNIKIILKNIGA